MKGRISTYMTFYQIMYDFLPIPSWSLRDKRLCFLLIPLTEIRLFQSLNHQKGNLKVWPLIKSDYYIVPNPSITLKKVKFCEKTGENADQKKI